MDATNSDDIVTFCRIASTHTTLTSPKVTRLFTSISFASLSRMAYTPCTSLCACKILVTGNAYSAII